MWVGDDHQAVDHVAGRELRILFFKEFFYQSSWLCVAVLVVLQTIAPRRGYVWQYTPAYCVHGRNRTSFGQYSTTAGGQNFSAQFRKFVLKNAYQAGGYLLRQECISLTSNM